MSDTIQQIRALLSELEGKVNRAEHVAEFRALSGLELPGIIADVVDLLMPELKPYVRVSRRGLQSDVLKSAYAGTRPGGGDPIVASSFKSVQQAFEGLTMIGAIRQEGDPNREGTLYRVLLPEEIPACLNRRAERARQTPTVPATEREADFYNVRENRLKIYERDNYQCTYCGKQLTRFTATLDHITPVSEGGDNSAENLKTACLQCIREKLHGPLGDFLIESNPGVS